MLLTRVVTGAIAAGVVIAGVALWRVPAVRRGRWIVAALAAYGAIAFAEATVTGIPLRDTLAGHGLFQILPRVLQGTFIGAFVLLPLGWIAAIVRAGIPRFREGSPRRAVYQAVALTTCVALVLTSLSLDRRDPPSSRPLSPVERISQLDRSLKAVEDGERGTPRDSWDPQYVVDRLGRDPQTLFTWVRDNTFWIPYQGVLRGPVGVLMDRQGNNLDRALLLATLLEKAGHEVRLAHGEIDQNIATGLLPILVADRSLDRAKRNDPAPSPGGVRTVLAQYQLDRAEPMVASQDDGLNRIAVTLRARIVEQTNRLLQVVEKPRPAMEWGKRLDAAMAALRDHWWVERRDGDSWLALDLLGQTNGTALTVAKETMTIKDLASSAYHEIVLRVVTERWSPSGLSERSVLEHVVRPADQIGQLIVLQFWPTDLINSPPESEAPTDWRATLLAQHKWAAVLTIAGRIVASTTLSDVDSDDAGQTRGGPMGGLGAALADALGGAKPAPNENATLSAVRLEFDIRTPGEDTRTIRRTIFDLIGPAGRGGSAVPALVLDNTKKLSRSALLTMETEIRPLNSSLAPDFVTHLAAQYFLSSRDLLRDLASEDFSPGSERTEQQMKNALPGLSRLMPLAATRLDWNRSAGHVFYDRTNIVTRHSYLRPQGDTLGVEEATDIVANEVGVDLAAEDAFAIRLEQGVVDTNAEALLKIGEGRGNVGAAFTGSQDWFSVSPTRRSELDAARLSADARRAISKDLDAGYAVVAPRKPVREGQEDFVGWWRIDPANGHTLGVAVSGWGQEITEYEMAVIRLNLRVTFEFILCQSFPQALNFLKAVNDLHFGSWHPSWTTYTPHKKAADVWNETKRVCLVQAILMGFVATLPLLLLTLKNSRWARAAEAKALEALEPRVPPNRPPIPPPEPLGGRGTTTGSPKGSPKSDAPTSSGPNSESNPGPNPERDPKPSKDKPPKCGDDSVGGGPQGTDAQPSGTSSAWDPKDPVSSVYQNGKSVPYKQGYLDYQVDQFRNRQPPVEETYNAAKMDVNTAQENLNKAKQALADAVKNGDKDVMEKFSAELQARETLDDAKALFKQPQRDFENMNFWKEMQRRNQDLIQARDYLNLAEKQWQASGCTDYSSRAWKDLTAANQAFRDAMYRATDAECSGCLSRTGNIGPPQSGDPTYPLGDTHPNLPAPPPPIVDPSKAPTVRESPPPPPPSPPSPSPTKPSSASGGAPSPMAGSVGPSPAAKVLGGAIGVSDALGGAK